MTLTIEFKPKPYNKSYEGPMEVWVCVDDAGLEKLKGFTRKLKKVGDSVHLVGPGAGGTDMDAFSLFPDPLLIDHYHIEVVPRNAFPTAAESDAQFGKNAFGLINVEVTPRLNTEEERNEVYVYIDETDPQNYFDSVSFLTEVLDENEMFGPAFGGDHLEAEPVVAENYVVGRHSIFHVPTEQLRTPEGHRAYEQECARRAYETYMALPWWKRLFTKPP